MQLIQFPGLAQYGAHCYNFQNFAYWKRVITDIAGLDDFSSRRLLRHADTQMTDRYSALNLEELKAKEEQYNPTTGIS